MDYHLSRWNGWNGNECVYKKDYDKAVDYYTIAIRLYPLEYRYFVNRSFCYDQLEQYKLALEDAQTAVGLHELRAKCYFRKARALKGLKRLKEAEVCFLKVIQLEGNDCVEAHKEIQEVRQIVQKSQSESTESFTSSESVDTVKTFDSNQCSDRKSNSDRYRSKAKKFNKNCAKTSKSSNSSDKSSLSSKTIDIPMTATNTKACTGFSGEKNILKELSDFLINKNLQIDNQKFTDASSVSAETKNSNIQLECAVEQYSQYTLTTKLKAEGEQKNKSDHKSGLYRKGLDQIVEIWDDSQVNYWSFPVKRPSNRFKIEPTNLWKLRGLYALNVKPNEGAIVALRKRMSDFGKVALVSLIPKTTSAIINFDNPESPRMAISKLQGAHIREICLPNQKLQLYFRPLNDSQNYPTNYSGAQLNNECYFWRTTGCIKNCKLKHIPANKAIDLQPWMQTKGRYKQQREFKHRFDII